jgi:hypothetical protein
MESPLLQRAQELGLSNLFYSPSELASHFRVGRELVDNAIATGELVASKRGQRVIVAATDAARWFDAGRIDPKSRTQSKPRRPKPQRQRFPLPEGGKS